MQQPSTDPLISHEQKESVSGYQSIESGNTGIPVQEEKTFFGHVREAKEQAEGSCDFCLMFFSLLLGSIAWAIVMAITLTLPLAMIIIGALNIHDCSAETMIPIFNIVGGAAITVNNVINLISRYRRLSDPTPSRKPTIIGWITIVLNIFLFIWFFVGCYWTYHIHQPAEAECNPMLYSFTFWLLTATFLFFGAVVVASSLALCLAMICW